ncbi:unnamed protein product [Rangifer tarandus platyrhynchus]|uniref:Uncharacterized protein n=2 Tax=Rangifer tarandus platyrhynchus TaxID=3082113 RepID=A0ACB0FDS8_RANTA|nr:unnamed protein product [Rangifer tarandus platyrhynchus]CAI9711235.1 unnamed protein product [Rangifer tarandus platyrhynchus]
MVGRGGASPAEPGLGEGRQPICQDPGLHAQRTRLQRLLVPVVSVFLCEETAARPCARNVGAGRASGIRSVMQAGPLGSAVWAQGFLPLFPVGLEVVTTSQQLALRDPDIPAVLLHSAHLILVDAAHRGQTQPLSLSAVISCLTLLPQAFPERCVGLRHLGVVGATLAPAEGPCHPDRVCADGHCQLEPGGHGSSRGHIRAGPNLDDLGTCAVHGASRVLRDPRSSEDGLGADVAQVWDIRFQMLLCSLLMAQWSGSKVERACLG